MKKVCYFVQLAFFPEDLEAVRWPSCGPADVRAGRSMAVARGARLDLRGIAGQRGAAGAAYPYLRLGTTPRVTARVKPTQVGWYRRQARDAIANAVMGSCGASVAFRS
jgi:hypothetical protein